MDYELTLFDRIEVIKTAYGKYDLEHNAYISFSGGKDSTVLHYLMDEAVPNERKQCEILWKPVYEEYRRIDYRLTKSEQIKLFDD